MERPCKKIITMTTVQEVQKLLNPATKQEKIKLKDAHAEHQNLMLAHVQSKLVRQKSHEALITHILTPKRLSKT